MAGTNTALFLTDIRCSYIMPRIMFPFRRERGVGDRGSLSCPEECLHFARMTAFACCYTPAPNFSAFLSLVRAVRGYGASFFECFTFTIQQHWPQAHTKGVVATQRGLCLVHKISRQNVPHIYGNEVLFWGVNLAESRWYCTAGSQRLRRRQQGRDAQEFR